MQVRDYYKEIVIIGGGLVGLLTASILANLGIKLLLIEKNDIRREPKQFDGKAISISYYSAEILKRHNLWDRLGNNYNDIKKIHISDQHSPLFLDFDSKLIDDIPLGFMVESQYLYDMLIDRIINSKLIDIWDNTVVDNIKLQNDYCQICTNNGDVNAKLVIAADGKKSQIRDMLGISHSTKHYNQTAILCNVTHRLNHNNIAYEIFMPGGPFAILPLKKFQNKFRSAVVWTEENNVANALLDLDQDEFEYHLSRRFTNFLGQIKIDSKIFSYPLTATRVSEIARNRVCLIGDAAHSIHPVAGQGFNQGIRDVEEITNMITQHRQLALDVGDSILLNRYQNARFVDNNLMYLFTDGMDKLFANNTFPVNKIRRAGLAAVNQIPRLKKFFMRYAMGYR